MNDKRFSVPNGLLSIALLPAGLLAAGLLALVPGCETPKKTEETVPYGVALDAIKKNKILQERYGTEPGYRLIESQMDERAGSGWFRIEVSGHGQAGEAQAVLKQEDGKWHVANLTLQIGAEEIPLMEPTAKEPT